MGDNTMVKTIKGGEGGQTNNGGQDNGQDNTIMVKSRDNTMVKRIKGGEGGTTQWTIKGGEGGVDNTDNTMETNNGGQDRQHNGGQ